MIVNTKQKMSKPTDLSIEAQRTLLKQVGSRISDNWFLACHLTPTYLYLDALFSSILDWISFYFIGDAAVFLLLTLPIIFFFQASGKQRKMQKLYSRSRLQILLFLFSCSFSYMVSPILGWITNQAGPCVQCVSEHLVPLGTDFQLPSPTVVLAAVMCAYIFKTKVKENSFFLDENSPKIKKFFAYFYDHLLTKTLGIIVLFFFSMMEVFYGKANILQVLFSATFGLLIDAFVSLVPLYVSLLAAGVSFVVGIIEIVFNKDPLYTAKIYDSLRRILLNGFGYVIYTIFLLGAFILSRTDFHLRSHFYDYLEDEQPDTDVGAAAFGELDTETDDNTVNLKDVLIKDLSFSAYATVIHIAAQVLEEMIIKFSSKKS